MRSVTLIELLVAITIFSLCVATVAGLFISAVKVQKRVLATQELIDQASYALDYMARALRMAIKDEDGTCLTTVGPEHNYETDNNKIRFLKYDPELNAEICQEFFLDLADNFRLKEKKSANETDNFSIPVPITSPDLRVLLFNINISGDVLGDGLQPRVTFFLGIAGKQTSLGRPIIQVQTSISQRNLDTAN